jgi:hypothetical protein
MELKDQKVGLENEKLLISQHLAAQIQNFCTEIFFFLAKF